jgi:hypothetical protein
MMKVSTRLGVGGREEWELPVDKTVWAEWLGGARRLLRASDVTTIVVPALDPHRARFHVLLLDETLRQLAFARFTRNPHSELGLAAERSFTDTRPTGFWSPRLLDHGAADGWFFTLTEALPPGPHRPAVLGAAQRRDIASEIRERLTPLLGNGRPVAHGDFAPWNVRKLTSGAVAVLDWEEARPAPSAADELWHALTVVLSAGGSAARAVEAIQRDLDYLSPEQLIDAVEFWALREKEAPPPEVLESDVTELTATLVSFKARLSEAFDLLRS